MCCLVPRESATKSIRNKNFFILILLQMNSNRLRSIRRSQDRCTRPRKTGFLWNSRTINWENPKSLSREAVRSTRNTTPFFSSMARLFDWNGFIGQLISSGTFGSPVNLRLPALPTCPRSRFQNRGYLRLGRLQSQQILVEAHLTLYRWVF